MTNLDQLVAISIGVSVWGLLVLQLRRDKADLSCELAEIKALLDER